MGSAGDSVGRLEHDGLDGEELCGGIAEELCGGIAEGVLEI